MNSLVWAFRARLAKAVALWAEFCAWRSLVWQKRSYKAEMKVKEWGP